MFILKDNDERRSHCEALLGIIKMLWIIIFFAAFANAPDSELEKEKERLLQISKLTLEREHTRKMLLLGMDPVTCKSTKGSEQEVDFLIDQVNRLNKGELVMPLCEEKIKEQLKPYDDKIKMAKEGTTDIPEGELLIFRTEKNVNGTNVAATAIENGPVLPVEPVVQEAALEVSVGFDEKSSSSVLVDRSGLTEEDRKWLFIYYERNRSHYESEDEDGLFLKVSKAYMRNLSRLMERPKNENE